MQAISAYQFEADPVRVVMVAGDPWWVASDIARVLGYRDAPNMVRSLDEDEKGTHILSTLGGQQEMNIISESGLYAAILKSRRPEAKRFRRWVTAEVLPELRRTGNYHLAGATTPPELGDDYDTARLSASVAVVREAKRLFGMRAARTIWRKLGLPMPIAEAKGDNEADHAEALKAWLADRKDCTIDEAAAGIGIPADEIDHGVRNQIGALLRLFGWWPRKRRLSRFDTANVFSPDNAPPASDVEG
jgi:hypothetical protein